MVFYAAFNIILVRPWRHVCPAFQQCYARALKSTAQGYSHERALTLAITFLTVSDRAFIFLFLVVRPVCGAKVKTICNG